MTFESIKDAVQQRADAADALGATLKFDFGDGQILYLDGSGENNILSEEDKEADCVVEVTKENLQSMMDGDLNPMGAFMSQQIKVKGDMGVAMKLQSLVS